MSSIIRLIGQKNDYDIVETVASINQKLSQFGLPNYHYTAKTLPNDSQLPWMQLSPPSDLDYLKFLAANLQENSKWTPNDDFVNQHIPLNLKKKFISENKSHLICHMNFCGYYVPVDFKDIPLPDQFLSYLGSSINLCNELKDIASKLKFDLGIYTPNLDTLYEQRITELESDGLAFEKMLLLYLYNITLGSINHNLIVEFS